MPFAFHSFIAFCIASQESQGLGPLHYCIPWLQPRSMKRDHASFVKIDGTANLTEIPRKEIREQTDADRSALGQLAPFFRSKSPEPSFSEELFWPSIQFALS